mgnify:CR=1 FL=1
MSTTGKADGIARRRLGNSGLEVSVVSFGTGDNAGLMVKGSETQQIEAITRALALGINYFDTSPDYGKGLAETNLGRALGQPGAHGQGIQAQGRPDTAATQHMAQQQRQRGVGQHLVRKGPNEPEERPQAGIGVLRHCLADGGVALLAQRLEALDGRLAVRHLLYIYKYNILYNHYTYV